MAATVALAQYGSGALITALLHPFGYAKVLMQVGHEPLPPMASTTFFFRREMFVDANILKYIGHIKKVDGFFGLYRGVWPRILGGTLSNIVQYNIQDKFRAARELKAKHEPEKIQEKEEDFVPWVVALSKETGEETVCRCVGIIVSHPFHVIMVRSMVQFIGRETKYCSPTSSIKEIYNQDGIMGFFSGLVPRLVGEVISIWLATFLAQAINKYLIREKDMKTYINAACGLVVSHFTYPFTLVSNVIAVNNCGLKGSSPPLMPVYKNWVDCMTSMCNAGDLKRGASAFWRVHKGPVVVKQVLAPVKSSRKFR